MNSILIAKNIIKRVLKGPKEILTIIVMPVILISVIIFALGKAGESIPKVGLVKLDNGFYSQQLANYISKQNVEAVELDVKSYEKALKQKKVSFAIVIPESFTKAIENGSNVELDFYANTNDANKESLKRGINQYITRLYKLDKTAGIISEKKNENKIDVLKRLVSEAKGEALGIEYRQTENRSTEINSASSSIGFTVMFMMILIFSTIGIILEDKKRLTLARMFVSPVMEWEIIGGNLIGSLILGLLQLIPLTVVFKIAFKIDSISKLLGMFLIFFCFLISIIGIGIGISGFIKKSMNPATLVATVITPTSIIGGCFIPESMLPDFINKIGYTVPQKWVMKAVEDILLGRGFQAIILNLIIILMFGLAFATFGLKTLRPINE